MGTYGQGLEASPVSLSERLADEVQLYCPLFQRRFVWGKSQIDQLWADIDTIRDGQYQRRFMGALVFDDERAPNAHNAGLYWVIDGQQRMTTMVLTVIALASHAQHYGEEGIEIASELYEQYVVSRKKQTKNHPKLRPTLNDTRQFNDILRSAFGDGFGIEIDVEREAGDSDGDMARAYKRILRHIESRTTVGADGQSLSNDDDVIQRIEELRGVLLDGLEFVEIRLGEAHDPNEVFDRLNNEGVKLGIIDLVRNEVLKRLRDDAKVALNLYATEWNPFEAAFEDASSKTNYFFPFALTVDSGVTKAGTFKTLAERWSKKVDKEVSPKEQTLEIMADLRRHQSSYNAIHSGQFSAYEEPLREGIRRLNALNRPGSSYPYFMQLLTSVTDGDTAVDAARQCIDVIESFLIRRGLAGIEPTGLHAVFKRLWKDAGADPKRVRQEIVSSTVVFPSDGLVKQAVAEGQLYYRRIRNYVVEEYERTHTKGDVLKHFPQMTVDHLMPQSLQGDWAKQVPADEHKRLLHTWANLVPLSNEANAGKGSSSWAEARARLSNETVFATTKNVYDTYETWSPTSIEKRSLELQAWAIQRWPSFEEYLT